MIVFSISPAPRPGPLESEHLDSVCRELLERGPVLDVAGGPRGELAFELEQLGIR